MLPAAERTKCLYSSAAVVSQTAEEARRCNLGADENCMKSGGQNADGDTEQLPLAG